MDAAAWKDGRGSHRYKIQINDIPGKRLFNQLWKEYSTDNWEVIGDGYTKKKDYFILIAARKFESEEHWLEWARAVDLNLVEHTMSGNIKPIKLGKNYKSRKAE